MRQGILLFFGVLGVGALTPAAHAQNFLDQNYGVQVIHDVVYGQAQVNFPTTHNVNLTADLYLPTGADLPRERPALVCVHGGRWAFGTNEAIENTEVVEPGLFLDTEGVYAREFAKRGYVCLSIDYRLINELPTGTGLFAGIPGFSTTNFLVPRIQSWLGTSPTSAQCVAAVEASVADTQTAIQWLRQHASQYHVDEDRIAVGGWSSGAVTSLYAAYAGGAPVAAVWMNSGGTFENDLIVTPGGPPVILFHGDADLEIPVSEAQSLNTALDNAGVPNAYYEIPAEDSYYLRGITVPPVAAKAGTSLEDALAEFLHAQMHLASLEAQNAMPVPAGDGYTMVVLAAMLSAAGMLVIRRRTRMTPAEIAKN